MLVVVSGLPGTGKSAVAGALAARLNAVQVSVDPIEDALLGAGLPRSWQTEVGAYEAARAVAEQNLAAGRDVVVDAVNDSQPARDTWRRCGVDPVFVLLELADETEHRRRLEQRVRGLVHLPEPTWADVRARAAGYEPWPDGGCLRLDAAEPVDRLVAVIIELLP